MFFGKHPISAVQIDEADENPRFVVMFPQFLIAFGKGFNFIV